MHSLLPSPIRTFHILLSYPISVRGLLTLSCTEIVTSSHPYSGMNAGCSAWKLKQRVNWARFWLTAVIIFGVRERARKCALLSGVGWMNADDEHVSTRWILWDVYVVYCQARAADVASEIRLLMYNLATFKYAYRIIQFLFPLSSWKWWEFTNF